MAVQRIQWTCPGCNRRYAIPADAPNPRLCPSCQSAAGTGAANPAAVAPTATLGAGPSAAGFELPQVEQPALPQFGDVDAPDVRYRRKYPALRALSFWYKLLACLVGVGSIIGLFSAMLAGVNAEATAERTVQIVTGLIVFGGGVVGTVTLLAFGELIRVVIDIEENTRQK